MRAAVLCVDAALRHERLVLAALVTALGGLPRCDGQDAGAVPLVRELRMAWLLSSVEVSVLSDIQLTREASVSALGADWATVLDQHDEALERLADELDAASASRRDAAR